MRAFKFIAMKEAFIVKKSLLMAGAITLLAGCVATATQPESARPARPEQGTRITLSPGAAGTASSERDTQAPWGEAIVRNVTAASLEVHWPDPAIATGAAMIVAPGGGFRFLSIDSEGEKVAQWLNAQGIAAFVLRYRVMETPASDEDFNAGLGALMAPLFGPGIVQEMQRLAPPAIADGVQAMRLLKSKAQAWSLKPERIGMIGFSAGAVVTLGVCQQADAADRPAYAAALYTGPWAIDKLVEDAPPLFIAAAKDDVLTAFSTPPVVKAWKQAGRPLEYKLYDSGGHGFGMKQQGKASDRWTDDFRVWLQAQGVIGAGI